MAKKVEKKIREVVVESFPPVIINGKPYETALYDGVRRFVGNQAVILMDEVANEANAGHINRIHRAFLRREVTLEDFIDFFALLNGSIGHFEDSLWSAISLNPQVFDGKRFEDLVTIDHNYPEEKK